jgi:hypothetical protein
VKLKSDSSIYDWKNTIVKRGWKYKLDAPDDKRWLKDRSKLFSEHGNGWWWFKSMPELEKYKRRYEDE